MATTKTVTDGHRQETLREDARLVASIMVVGALGAMSFVLVDANVITESGWRQVAALARAACLLISVALAAILWKTESVRTFDLVTTGWVVFVLVATTAFNWSRPPDYDFYLVWNVILIMAVFAMVRIPFPWQMTAMSVFMVSEVTLLFRKFGPEMGFRGWTWTFYLVMAFLLGAIAARLMEQNRRSRWASLERERATLTELRQALEEVRTLQGILPVCANCHSVRDEDRGWEPMAEILGRLSASDVSHTLCPDCERDLYPELREQM